jgi:hypothetical protein
MSRIRKDRKIKLNKRTIVIKKQGCNFCSNDKMHTNKIRVWCTKCKKERLKQ